MKLIVGLGNPGSSYNETRHNLGFKVIDNFLLEKNLSLNKKKFNGEYIIENIHNEKVIIAKPLTFMNHSGQFLIEIMSYYKIPLSNILIIVDDKDRNFDRYKLVNKGSSGGQNGINNIIQMLGTSNFLRLKCGIGTPLRKDTSKYVLENFSKKELEIVKNMLPTYNNIINDFILNSDYILLSNKYNGDIK